MFSKYYFMLSAVVSIAISRNVNQEIFRLPPNFLQKHAELVENCIKETGVSPDTLEKVVTWNVNDDEVTKSFVYCFGTRLKVADENGHAVSSTFESLLSNHPRLNEFKVVVGECNKMNGKDGVDTLFLVGKCLHEEAPVAFTL